MFSVNDHAKKQRAENTFTNYIFFKVDYTAEAGTYANFKIQVAVNNRIVKVLAIDADTGAKISVCCK